MTTHLIAGNSLQLQIPKSYNFEDWKISSEIIFMVIRSTTIHGSGVDYKCNRKSEHLLTEDENIVSTYMKV